MESRRGVCTYEVEDEIVIFARLNRGQQRRQGLSVVQRLRGSVLTATLGRCFRQVPWGASDIPARTLEDALATRRHTLMQETVIWESARVLVVF